MSVFVVLVDEPGRGHRAGGDELQVGQHAVVIPRGDMREKGNVHPERPGNAAYIERRPSWNPGVPGAILSDVADDEQFRCLPPNRVLRGLLCGRHPLQCYRSVHLGRLRVSDG